MQNFYWVIYASKFIFSSLKSNATAQFYSSKVLFAMEHWTNDQIENFLLALTLLWKVISNAIKLYCILYYWYLCYFFSLNHFSFYVFTKASYEKQKQKKTQQTNIRQPSNENEYMRKEILSLIALPNQVLQNKQIL